MKDMTKYQGIFPAFYACYDDNGEISPERTKALVRWFIDQGVKGFYVNGSSGECIYQSVEEKKLILECVMEEARGKLTVIAHVACNNTRDSQVLAAHAESLGVDAIGVNCSVGPKQMTAVVQELLLRASVRLVATRSFTIATSTSSLQIFVSLIASSAHIAA